MIALYVLLTVITGRKHWENSQYEINWNISADPVNYSNYVTEQNHAQMKQMLEKILAQKQLTAEIQVEEEQGKYIVEFESEQSDDVYEVLKDVLKNDGNIQVRTGENNS